jgi:hypothetical protein
VFSDRFVRSDEEPSLYDAQVGVVLEEVVEMQTKDSNQPSRAPVPGMVPTPGGVEDDAVAADQRVEATPAASAREARRRERNERRQAPAERAGVMIPNRRKRLPFETPLMRVVATAGIVGIAVVIAAIMTSQGSAGWLVGLVVSIVSLVLAAVLWSSRRL